MNHDNLRQAPPEVTFAANGNQQVRYHGESGNIAPPRNSMDDRLEVLRHLCGRLDSLQVQLTVIANGVRAQPGSDRDKDQVRPEPFDMIGKFQQALGFAADRITALEQLAQRLDADLFNHSPATPTGARQGR